MLVAESNLLERESGSVYDTAKPADSEGISPRDFEPIDPNPRRFRRSNHPVARDADLSIGAPQQWPEKIGVVIRLR